MTRGDTHDQNADVYDIVYAPYFPPEKTLEEVRRISGMVRPGGRVLDLGSGTGRHLIPLARRGYHVTGIESSEAMAKRCEEKLESEGLSADIVVGDAKTVPLPESDLIICMWNAFCELCHSTDEARSVLREAHASLARGGAILIQQHDPDVFTEGEEMSYTVVEGETHYALRWSVREKDGPRTVSEEHVTITGPDGEERRSTLLTQRWFTREEYRGLLEGAGFADVRIEEAKDTNEFLVSARAADR